MLNRKPEDLLRRLIRGGISPRRARRVLLELKEHRADVVAERIGLGDTPADAQAAADARLGGDDTWVAQMLARPELQSWARHHPGAAFAVMPPMAFCLMFVASILAWIGVFQLLKGNFGALTSGVSILRWAADIASLYMLWIAPIITGGMVGVLAARSRVPPLWPCVGIALTSIVGALTNFSVDLPPGAVKSLMSAGIGIGLDHALVALLRAACCSILVILPYLGWYRSQRRRAGELS
jgi:hypothetical protein